MRIFLIVGVLSVLYGCDSLKEDIVIDLPNVPAISICNDVADANNISSMKTKIESETFKDDRLERGLLVTEDFCFVASQVIEIMESFTFDDAKLDMAKALYDQTTDQQNYDLVADALTYKSNKDKLKEFIASQP